MDKDEFLQNIDQIKDETGLDEIGIFDEDGYIIHTTQEENLKPTIGIMVFLLGQQS